MFKKYQKKIFRVIETMIAYSGLLNTLYYKHIKYRGKIGSNFKIGRHSKIKAENLSIGDNVFIGHNTIITGRTVKIGNNSRIESFVTIGGMQTQKSEIIIGNFVWIYPWTFINNSYPVIIGDRVPIGGHCLIFTHGVWKSIFEGYPVDLAPVIIEEDVWIPFHVCITPGVTIRKGATIGLGAVVTRDIPPYSLAVGVPARVIKSPPDFPRRLNMNECKNILFDISEDFLEYIRELYSAETKIVERDKIFIADIIFERKIYSLIAGVEVKLEDIPHIEVNNKTLIVMSIGSRPFPLINFPQTNVMWFDLINECHSPNLDKLGMIILKKFLPKYGIFSWHFQL